MKQFAAVSAILNEKPSMLRLFNEIRKSGPIQKSQAGLALAVSKPTRYSLMREMLDLELITERVTSQNGKHRRSTVIQVDGGKYYSLGIDIHMEGLSLLLLDIDQTVVSTRSFHNVINSKTGISEDGRNVITRQLQKEVPAFLEKWKIKAKQIIAIGISDASVVDSEDRVSVYNRYIPGWEDVPIGNILTRIIPAHAFLVRDANMTALAETRAIGPGSIADTLCVSLRHGIGLGIVINGRIYTGRTGNAGEWSIMNLFGPESDSGPHKDLDALLGIGALREIASRLDNPAVKKKNRNPDSDDAAIAGLFAAYEAGDSKIESKLNDYIKLMAVHLANLIYLFDIEHIIIAGRFTQSGEKFRSELESRLRGFMRKFRKITIMRGSLGTGAAVLGAAYMAQEAVLSHSGEILV